MEQIEEKKRYARFAIKIKYLKAWFEFRANISNTCNISRHAQWPLIKAWVWISGDNRFHPIQTLTSFGIRVKCTDRLVRIFRMLITFHWRLQLIFGVDFAIFQRLHSSFAHSCMQQWLYVSHFLSFYLSNFLLFCVSLCKKKNHSLIFISYPLYPERFSSVQSSAQASYCQTKRHHTSY